MTEPKIIYKRTATGAVQVWWQEINPAGDGFRTVSGQQDGEKVSSEWTICTPKNVGRSNETTPQEQCRLEVEANYTKKLAQGGYHEDIADIDTPKFFQPMLAKNYEDRPPTSIGLEAGMYWSQPKLDGVRCIADVDGLWSRKGKPILSAPHISENLERAFRDVDSLRFDGELYGDTLSDKFQKLISLAKKAKPTPAQLEESRELLQYHIYDFPAHDGPFADRYKALTEIYHKYEFAKSNSASIRLVPTVQARNQKHLDDLQAEYLESGMEGQMVRVSMEGYEQKRSFQLLKRKEFKDAEFEIVRIEEGIGNRTGMAGRIVIRLPDGTESASGIKGSHEFCRQLLRDADRYVGGEATVKYFRLTDDGKPYLPVTVAVYEGKRDL